MVATKKLIINADGYGFTPGVNEGVIKTFEFGLVRSTSCTPNFGFLTDLGHVARQFPHVSFGIHFNISVGRPVSDPNKVPTLVNNEGKFYSNGLLNLLITGKIKKSDVLRELTAQAALMADAGVKISHWDGHQNKHLYPVYFESALEVAKRFNIRGVRTHRRYLFGNNGPVPAGSLIKYYAAHPARIGTHAGGRLRALQARLRGHAMADRLITPGYADNSHKSHDDFWFCLARKLPPGTSEIYCHPAFPDDLLRANAKYVEQRAQEVAHLTDPNLRLEFQKNGIELISFNEL